MELGHHHVIPFHILDRSVHESQVEAPDQVRDCHVHLHVGETVCLRYNISFIFHMQL